MRRGSLTEGGNTMSLLSPLSGGAVQGDRHYDISTVDRSHGPRVYISATGFRRRTDEQVMISSEKARQVWLAADELDQLAREYRRQVPRGQMS